MHRIALHRLEWAWSLSEGTICEKACQFLGCKSKTTEPTHSAPKAICLGVLSVPNPKPGGSLAAEQSHSSSRSSAPLCPGPCFSLPADATWERTWAEGYLITHDWFIPTPGTPSQTSATHRTIHCLLQEHRCQLCNPCSSTSQLGISRINSFFHILSCNSVAQIFLTNLVMNLTLNQKGSF